MRKPDVAQATRDLLVGDTAKAGANERASRLTHLSDAGEARMVDVSDKASTD